MWRHNQSTAQLHEESVKCPPTWVWWYFNHSWVYLRTCPYQEDEGLAKKKILDSLLIMDVSEKKARGFCSLCPGHLATPGIDLDGFINYGCHLPPGFFLAALQNMDSSSARDLLVRNWWVVFLCRLSADGLQFACSLDRLPAVTQNILVNANRPQNLSVQVSGNVRFINTLPLNARTLQNENLHNKFTREIRCK